MLSSATCSAHVAPWRPCYSRGNDIDVVLRPRASTTRDIRPAQRIGTTSAKSCLQATGPRTIYRGPSYPPSRSSQLQGLKAYGLDEALRRMASKKYGDFPPGANPRGGDSKSTYEISWK